MRIKKIAIIEKRHLSILWENSGQTKIKLANLRRNCPCAICDAEREERGSKYIPLYTAEQLTIVNIQTIGHYAIGVQWKDGHNTGIYEFEHLRKLNERDK